MNKTDLEREFERNFELTRDNYKALCPFHDEHKASFFIHHTELVGNCFGCGICGSVDSLLARYKGVSIENARRLLDCTISDSLFKATSRRRKSGEQKYYPESWLAPWKEEVHKYVIERGFRTSTIAAAGGLYDLSAKRQVFPHRDRGGRLLGATGRACRYQEPKWYHYWGYDKGQALYRPFDIDSLRPIILVEGVFDLLWLHQNGVDNVVATLGAKPTERQIRELQQTSEEIILGLDNDEAGTRGTESTFRRIRRSNKVRFINWPRQRSIHDWMDLTNEEIKGVIDGARPYLQQAVEQRPRLNRGYVETKAREVWST